MKLCGGLQNPNVVEALRFSVFCCGDTRGLAKHLSVSFKDVCFKDKHPLFADGRTTRPHLVKANTKVRKILKTLYKAGNGVSKKKLGSFFCASEIIIQQISIEDKWPVGARSKGRAHNRNMKQKDRAKIVNLFQGGTCALAITRKLGWSNSSVKRVLRENGCKLFSSYTFRPKTEKQILLQYSKGIGVGEISRRLGVDYSVITRLLKNKGVAVRTNAQQIAIGAQRRRLTHNPNLTTHPNSFSSDVRLLTSYVYKSYGGIINPKNLPIGRWSNHLDHLYSISAARKNVSGLKHPINIWEICHPANLRVIPASENLKKNAKRVLTAQQLRVQIREWNLKYMDPFFINDNLGFTRIRTEYGTYDNFGELGHSDERRYYQTSYRP